VNKVMTPHESTRRARVREILRELATIDYALPGSVVRRSTACGKPNCRCTADPPVLHGPYLSWIRKIDGKPITRKLTQEQEQRYQAWFDNARRLRELVSELQALSVQAMEDAENSPAGRATHLTVSMPV
jgi:hypothetical protein